MKDRIKKGRNKTGARKADLGDLPTTLHIPYIPGR
jgi:hypothetical protein